MAKTKETDSVEVLECQTRASVVISVDEMARLNRQAKLAGEHPPFLSVIPSRLQFNASEQRHMAVYHPTPDVHRFISAAIKRVSDISGVSRNGYDPLAVSMLFHPQPVETTISMLLDLAVTYELGGDQRKANELLGIAQSLETKVKPRPEASAASEWSATQALLELLPKMDEKTLSNGEKFKDHRERLVAQRAADKIGLALSRTNQPFSEVVTDLQSSLANNLRGKYTLLPDKIRKAIKQGVATSTANLEDCDPQSLTSKLVYIESSNSTKEAIETAEELRTLVADIKAIEVNLGYCPTFLGEGVDYENFDEIANRLIGELQDKIAQRDQNYLDNLATAEIDEIETQLQAIGSLRGQLREVRRQRDNAKRYIYGGTVEESGTQRQMVGIAQDASAARRKRLSLEIDSNGIPRINALAAQPYSQWLEGALAAKGIKIRSTDDLVGLYAQVEGYINADGSLVEGLAVDDLIAQINQLVPNSKISEVGFSQFFEKAYISSINDTPLDNIKAELMRLLTPALSEVLGVDLRQEYDKAITTVSDQIETADLIEVVKSQERENLIRDLTDNLALLVKHFSDKPDTGIVVTAAEQDQFVVEHTEQLISALLAYHEISVNANDNHLNSESVLTNLADSIIGEDPITLQVIRCLRWCYPDKDIEVVPHMGDWKTKGYDGRELWRMGWVEKAKLEIFNNVIVKPVLHHGIPVKAVRLLCTGDYELVEEAHGYSLDSPQRINARAYVDNVRQAVPEMGLFPVAVEVKSFAELIDQFGQDKFDDLMRQSYTQYDAVTRDNSLRYLNLNASEIERIIDTEHGYREPFVSWWTRADSRRFTRYLINFNLAFGVVIGSQRESGPQLVTISGNQYAGTHFSKGHLIDKTVTPVGVTFMNSVNDGDQSAHFKKMTTIVGGQDGNN